MLLLAKLILVPTLIAAVTLAARRWGPRVAGLLTSLPVVGGPILVIYALEQGDVFAARAAEATLLGLIAVVAFCIAYATVAMRARWPLSVLSGWLAFTVVTALLYFTRFPLIVDLAIAFAVLLTSGRLLPAAIPAEAAGCGADRGDDGRSPRHGGRGPLVRGHRRLGQGGPRGP